MPSRLLRSSAAIAGGFVLFTTAAAAQQPRVITADDYARAERFLAPATVPLVYGGFVRPSWLPDDRFWYRNATAEGYEFILVDPARGTRTRAFDQTRIAAALSTALGKSYDPNKLPFTSFELAPGGKGILVRVEGKRWSCNPETGRCDAAVDDREAARAQEMAAASGASRSAEPPVVMSPDGKRAAFIRDWNLWVRDVATGQDTQLTTDGVQDYGYATDNAGWIHSDRAILAWSPDSRKIATFRQDQRKVGEMYLVSTAVGHPTLKAWKYPLPGDSVVSMIERVVIDVDAKRVVPFRMSPDQHRTTFCDHISCDGEFTDVEWYPDGSHVAFVSVSRDHKDATLRVADASSGEVRDVLSEHVATQYESGIGGWNWRVLPASNEVIWFSERDDWGQLYLYDLTTGKLKGKITTGVGNVTEILRVDPKSRTTWFAGVGKTVGRDPYFRHLYRVGLDGKRFALLSPENADHQLSVSPSGKLILDSYSTPVTPPVTALRDLNGKVVQTLERADISKLVAAGWKPPLQITVKARDGKTDLYGLMFTPTSLDSTRKYPIVNYIYPGPQTGSVGGRGFSPARGDLQALAELGFVVVAIDGMGTPWRSKSFHDAYYAQMGDNTLPDQVAGMKELGRRYRFIDIDRAGIWGHSGGGFATADAMFRYPDFFKVGISESGNHDNRVYEDDWGERYQGLLVRAGDGSDNYAPEANQTLAKNLKGKLLLAHGTMDDNVPPNNTLLVVDALIKANKDFDLLLLPNQPHGYGAMSNYMMRRRWDYFVKNLMGAEPPKEYVIGGNSAR
ncbi:MAG: prolyl oligopeptidase family serine peptidase [Gemmatimonadaceae bacterium]|nr:prolyl oligopeptidase family serine peptidase [Gemmatimonadaceae bacterium]